MSPTTKKGSRRAASTICSASRCQCEAVPTGETRVRFHDLAGNVAEWTHDWYVADLGASSVSDPLGPVTGALRVKRNGY